MNSTKINSKGFCASSSSSIARTWIPASTALYDALYAYCQEMIRRGKPDAIYR